LLFGIEIDGGYHNKEEQREYDKRREEIIGKYGIQIVRFTNEKVETNLQEVTKELEQHLNKREQEIQQIKIQRQTMC
jgi:leucyl-tRNA synthetase